MSSDSGVVEKQMRNDHIQGILFSEQDRLDLRHRGVARRLVTSIVKKGKKRADTRLKKRDGFSGPTNLSNKSSAYDKAISELAGRLKNTDPEEDE